MAIKIKFDSAGNPEPPTIILANRNGNKLGQLSINADSIELSDSLNDVSEISFTANKYIDGEIAPLWDKLVDFKLVWCKEWDCWFEIKVELDETTETVKTVFCTQLGQAELSQIKLYNIEINTEKDIERDDYKISILYDPDHPEASILNRILKDKAPHYSIAYVSPTIAKIQRSFSFNSTFILDAFQEISEEIGCLFKYSAGIEDGILKRKISVYDLQQTCNDCGYRGEFVYKCSKCNSTNIENGYGNDTLIFVTADELASEGIQLVTDTDSVKNCFKLEAGDDLMTATVRNCNPNGTDYIWRFSDMIKEDMSDELVKKIESYDATYKDYYNNYTSNINATLLNKYNNLVTKYSTYDSNLQSITSPIKGYPNLMNAYYNTIDLALYLKSSLMPSIKMSETDAAKQAALLTRTNLSPVAVNTEKLSSVSLETANSAVLSMAKIIVKPTYNVEINTSTLSNDKKTWTGSFVVTNYSDEEDTATSNTVNVTINNNTETFIKQKIEKALNKENTDDLSISGLFEKEYDDFCAELKKYALNPLKSFYDACDSCLNILIDQGAGDKNKNLDLYNNLYQPYYKKSSAITDEIKLRESEIAIIEGVWDNTDEDNPKLKTKGLQYYIENCRNKIQNALNFENYLGKDLWLEFCTYRREDTYSNDNYISDGLNNAELFKKASEFIEVAENEIYKSSELQHSISTTLNNLLAIPKFESLVESFETGNWLRVLIDDVVYKLRLLKYDISYSDFNNIPVEFSDVTKIKNSVTDIEKVLSQASSMATSYDSIQRQAEKGDKVKGTIEQWISDGLSSALVRIQNNDSEDITLTENGLLCRAYDDITETYAPEQFKLTHNIMAYTTDNWKTVSSALGKHGYKYWNDVDKKFVDDIDYGLSTKFVTAGYVTGSQIISGEIISDNYEPNKKGTYFNLINGDFEIAGGNIIYSVDDNDKSTLTLKNVNIEWSHTTKPEIKDVSGLEDYIEQIGELETNVQKAKSVADNAKTIGDKLVSELGFKETEIAGSYVISPAIAGGTLLIGDKTGTYAQITTDGKLICTGADISGNITANSLTLGSGVSIASNKVSGLHTVATSGKYSDLTGKPTIPTSVADLGLDTSKIIFKGDITQTTKTDSNGISYVETTVPSSNGTIKYSTYNAGDYIVFGRSKGTNSTGNNYICVSKEGLLTARNAVIYGTVYATDGEFSGKITATSLTLGKDVKIGTGNISGLSTVATSGSYNDLSNKPTIPKSVADLGLDTSKIIFKGDITQSAKTDSNGISYVETVIPSSSGTIKYSTYNANDYLVFGRSKGTNSSGNNYISISKEGLLTARNALIYGTIYATDGEFYGAIKSVNDKSTYKSIEIKNGLLRFGVEHDDATNTSTSSAEIKYISHTNTLHIGAYDKITIGGNTTNVIYFIVGGESWKLTANGLEKSE